MGKKNKSQNKAAAEVKKPKKKKREVLVVSCQPDFPISSKPKRDALAPPSQQPQPQPQQKLLDWNDTAHEIRSLGATAFVGQQKRNFEDEQYEQLTGRKRKKHQVPLPIVRGIKKKAEQRLAREIQEAKESGTVLPKSLTQKKAKAQDKTSRIHGPAPTVGFMSKGVLKVKRPD